MTITPWRWETSNGSATVAQTHAAYAALVSNGNTSLFHRNVWNDLVNKVNEVLAAMNLAWVNTYGSVNATKMTQLYETLTATRFNALRYNTRYNSWSWARDTGSVGYIGRVDFRGVGSVGETAADTVYGRYFLELAERLNVVIGIINGTTATEDLDLTLISNLLPEVELLSATSESIKTTASGIILSDASLKSENLPTMTLLVVVPSPTLYAELETDEIASRLGGYVFITLEMSERRLIRLAPVPFASLFTSSVNTASNADSIESRIITASAIGSSSTLGDIHSLGSVAVGGILKSDLLPNVKGVSLHGINPGWTHTRVNLDITNTLIAEMIKIFETDTIERLSAFSLASSLPPRVFTTEDNLFFNIDPKIELSDPLPVTTDTIIKFPSVLANVSTAQFIKDFIVSENLSVPTSAAKLELDHVATMLRAYLGMLQSSNSALAIVENLSFEIDANISLPLISSMVSAFAPSIEYLLKINLVKQTHAHTAKAGTLKKNTGISLDTQGNGMAGKAGILELNATNNTLMLSAPFTSHRSAIIAARSRARLTEKGIAHSIESVSSVTNTSLDFTPSVNATLAAMRGTEELLAAFAIFHSSNGNLDKTNHLHSVFAMLGISISHEGNLGYILFTDLSAFINIEVSCISIIETEGGAGWQYPTYEVGDLTVYQIYITEQNKEHVFLDPVNSFMSANMSHDVHGKPDFYITVPMSRENIHGVNISSTLHFLNPLLWEHPVKTGEDIYLTQALSIRDTEKNKLEVI